MSEELRRARSARSRARANAPQVVARHGRQRKFPAWKAVIALVAGAMASVLVASVSLAAIVATQLQSNINVVSIAADSAGPIPNIGAYPGGFNILIAGSDTRAGQGGIGGTVADASGSLNDVNLLMHVSQDQTSATVVSIPRDMVVPIPKCSNGGPAAGLPINTALSYGGLDCVAKTVENLTGLTIQFAGLITFTGVIAMSDAVGGVPVCVNAPINDPYTGLNLPQAGTYTLSGANALAFLRSRHGIGDGSDLGRISSQQVFLSSLIRTIRSNSTLTDLTKLYSLAQAATQNITLSQNFSHLDTLVSIALVLKNIPLNNIVFVQYPGNTGGTGIYTGKVQPDTATAKKLFSVLKADQAVGLDASALLNGGHTGSTLDPNATASPAPTTAPSAAPTPAPTATSTTVNGLKGQTAAQQTCSVAYHF